MHGKKCGKKTMQGRSIGKYTRWRYKEEVSEKQIDDNTGKNYRKNNNKMTIQGWRGFKTLCTIFLWILSCSRGFKTPCTIFMWILSCSKDQRAINWAPWCRWAPASKGPSTWSFFRYRIGEHGLTNIKYLKFTMTDQVKLEKWEGITISFTLFQFQNNWISL